MKKIFYSSLLFLAVLNFFASKAQAQYYITSENWQPIRDSGYRCSQPTLYVTTNAYASSLSINTYYGDGNITSTPVSDGGGFGYANCYSYYSFPGMYTVKYVLFEGTTAVDSLVNLHEYLYCSAAIIKCVYDSLGTGIYDSTHDHFIVMPVKIEVDHNGIPFDTATITSGMYYPIEGALGDIYSFRILSAPAGLTVSFPAGGVLYDTIQTPSNNYVPQFFGFKCSGTTSADLAIYPILPVTGVIDQFGSFYITNASCDPANVTVSFNFSPKYVYWPHAFPADPAPSSASGNTVTWNVTGITAVSPVQLSYRFWDGAEDLVAGDTVHDHITATPTSGGSPATVIVIDTVKGSSDPNEMSVTPSGYISAGTTLQYTINFENTGTDTAYNISVYDTLPGSVDAQSLKIIMASAVMNIAMLSWRGNTIVKFDFPNINLLDSANHGLCNGAVVFTVNTYSGLADGTTIFNHAGIFFDYNPVVLTDTVEDIIGPPLSVAVINNSAAIDLYPNPAGTFVNIRAQNPIDQLTISNVLGQTVYSNDYTSNQVRVDVSGLPVGMYFVKVNGSEVRKFCKTPNPSR